MALTAKQPPRSSSWPAGTKKSRKRRAARNRKRRKQRLRKKHKWSSAVARSRGLAVRPPETARLRDHETRRLNGGSKNQSERHRKADGKVREGRHLSIAVARC